MDKSILERLEDIDNRLRGIEEKVNMGRGAVGMFLSILAVVGTVCGLVKFFGK